MDNFLRIIEENIVGYDKASLHDVAMENVRIYCICDENASENTQQSINRVALTVGQFFDRKLMRHTIAAMLEKARLGEPEGNCHNIALAFMADLIISGLGQGWYWVQGGNPKRKTPQGTAWEHSWLEYNGMAVDATIKQKLRRQLPTIVIQEARSYYKQMNIVRIHGRRNARQTRRLIFRYGK